MTFVGLDLEHWRRVWLPVNRPRSERSLSGGISDVGLKAGFPAPVRGCNTTR